jgi:hypothetical protein
MAGGGGGAVYVLTTSAAGGVGGGGAGTYHNGAGVSQGTPGNGTVNLGGGGGGGTASGTSTTGSSSSGGSGVVILKYADSKTITIGAGLTGTTAAPSGGFKVTTITAGTGNVSWA